ncbi:MAG: methylated-DNA--[protein]-cysteine S-methyltransferase [Ignavibacterium sp.]|jgi:methylated-DNA-[protein]-cysteine S-methyltransferase|nr:methylated-DNA--[protein]-cysteine S-methyltransferase [Ignavibacterium sp.]
MSDTNYYSEEVISDINIVVLVSSKGVKKIFLHPPKEIKELLSATKLRSDDPYLFGIFNQLKEYFEGTRRVFDVPLDVDGTDFQKKVWNELQKIPYGKTISYKTLSEKLGDVKAIRAVGKANGQNPAAIIIPCHRVIGTDGNLIGYAGGLAVKEKLLHLEGALNLELFD